MNDRQFREMTLRLDTLERMVREMHASVMTGGDAPLEPGDPAFRIAAREMLKGNTEPIKALGGRKLVQQ